MYLINTSCACLRGLHTVSTKNNVLFILLADVTVVYDTNLRINSQFGCITKNQTKTTQHNLACSASPIF